MIITLNSIAQIPTNGLVGWYPFNGNANDESGNSNNGMVNGAILTTDRFGNLEKAYYFKGVDAQINVPSSSSISNFPNGQTLAFWMKISAFPTDGKEHYMIDKTDNSGIPNTKFYQAFISDYGQIDNIVYRYAESAASSSQGTAIPFSGIQLDKWIHVCFTTDLTITNTYINGVLFQTYNHYSPIGLTVNPLIFGNTNGINNTNAPYSGNLDDIGIWNRPLTQAEITNLYDSNYGNVGIGITNPQRKLHVNDIMRLEPRNTAPSNPSKGDIYFDGILNKLRVYDGTTWQNCW